MRQALMKTKIGPAERINSIKDMVNKISEMKTNKSWGFEIVNNPISFETSVLDQAQIYTDRDVVHINEQVLRRLSIQAPVELEREKWILCYTSNSCGREAKEVYSSFQKACRQLNVKVEEPYRIELNDEADMHRLE